jgi:hypothetical protein
MTAIRRTVRGLAQVKYSGRYPALRFPPSRTHRSVDRHAASQCGQVGQVHIGLGPSGAHQRDVRGVIVPLLSACIQSLQGVCL